MKKNISVIVLFALLIIGLAFVPQAKAQQCATFDFFTNTFHVPCFNLFNQSYWLDMGFARSPSAVLEIKNFDVIGAESSDPDCASFDLTTSIFHIPCASVKGDYYWIDYLVNMSSLEFTMQNYGYVNTAPGYGNPAPGY